MDLGARLCKGGKKTVSWSYCYTVVVVVVLDRCNVELQVGSCRVCLAETGQQAIDACQASHTYKPKDMDLPVLLGSPTENLRTRGTPVLRLMLNLRFTNAPTDASAFDMVGNYVASNKKKAKDLAMVAS